VQDQPEKTASGSGADPILLYDGECGLCDQSIQLILRNDRRKTLRFAALQGETAQAILRRHDLEPPDGTSFDTMVFVRNPDTPEEEVFLRSHAALHVGRYLGGRYGALARLCQVFPGFARESIYRLISRTRHAFSRAPACRLPSPDESRRFLA